MLPDVMDCADSRMVQSCGQPRLVVEAPLRVRIIAERCADNLDCHLTAKPRIPCAVHLAHSSMPRQRENFIGSEPRPGSKQADSLFLGGVDQRSRVFTLKSATARTARRDHVSHRGQSHAPQWNYRFFEEVVDTCIIGKERLHLLSEVVVALAFGRNVRALFCRVSFERLVEDAFDSLPPFRCDVSHIRYSLGSEPWRPDTSTLPRCAARRQLCQRSGARVPVVGSKRRAVRGFVRQNG